MSSGDFVSFRKGDRLTINSSMENGLFWFYFLPLWSLAVSNMDDSKCNPAIEVERTIQELASDFIKPSQ